MIGPLVAISGMLAAASAAPPRTATIAAVEISRVTHAGEGAEGVTRYTRDGCYQTESGGSTGGAAYARTSEAGCHLATDVAPVFARLDAIEKDALVREAAPGGGAGRGTPAPAPGGAETRVVLVRPDRTRWVAANRTAADDMLRAINELPGESQSDASPPGKPIGKGPQLVVLTVTSGGSQFRQFDAVLASDGRWWCTRMVLGPRPGLIEPPPAKPAAPLTDAPARLRRIYGNTAPQTRDDEPAEPTKLPGDIELSVQGAWPGQARGPIRPAGLADSVTRRFAAEMKALSPACAVR
jgi:hypothetical protein